MGVLQGEELKTRSRSTRFHDIAESTGPRVTQRGLEALKTPRLTAGRVHW